VFVRALAARPALARPVELVLVLLVVVVGRAEALPVLRMAAGFGTACTQRKSQAGIGQAAPAARWTQRSWLLPQRRQVLCSFCNFRNTQTAKTAALSKPYAHPQVVKRLLRFPVERADRAFDPASAHCTQRGKRCVYVRQRHSHMCTVRSASCVRWRSSDQSDQPPSSSTFSERQLRFRPRSNPQYITNQQRRRFGGLMHIATTIVSSLLALVLVGSAGAKLTKAPQVVDTVKTV